MIYQLPELPYDDEALAPNISRETVEFHYGIHTRTYIDNLNRLIRGTDFEDMELEEIIETAKGELFNNAAQAWNHIFYFFSFAPDGPNMPSGKLFEAIERDFGSFEDFKRAFVAAGVSIFGSGWVWLSRDNAGKLHISKCSNAENPMTAGLTPLLTFDVWEHAYYLDYQNRRADALKALWEVIDWNVIDSRY
jgi:Fe-Mn family superoxide dismutase